MSVTGEANIESHTFLDDSGAVDIEDRRGSQTTTVAVARGVPSNTALPKTGA
ncbi:MAG: hypothetical protein ACOC9J_01585 [Persicimonas sp.]